jgi:glycosyltransferase involved in cell wall biosynthesis
MPALKQDCLETSFENYRYPEDVMRIAQIAPLWERVPPPAYGGIELVVSLLTDELVRRGHEVTLFASGDSLSLAKIQSVHPKALRLDAAAKEYLIYEMLQMAQVYDRSSDFDIIHSHVGCMSLPFAGLVKTPTVHTLHGIFTPDNEKLFAYAHRQSYISISNSQREPRLGLNYVATVHNGISLSAHQFHAKPANPPYLAFLGRISPEKGTHLAIEIARQAGLSLKIAGKIDRVDRDYYEQVIQPQIDGKQIEFVGEANQTQKNALLGGAIATLFPITWREPFGLVMIESMAAGTPVIALSRGAAPEIIQHGQTGFLCEDVAGCVAAVQQVAALDRANCRSHVANRFSVQMMVNGYEAVYQSILAERFAQNGQDVTSNVTSNDRQPISL